MTKVIMLHMIQSTPDSYGDPISFEAIKSKRDPKSLKVKNLLCAAANSFLKTNSLLYSLPYSFFFYRIMNNGSYNNESLDQRFGK